jgi:hypothetical protein
VVKTWCDKFSVCSCLDDCGGWILCPWRNSAEI